MSSYQEYIEQLELEEKKTTSKYQVFIDEINTELSGFEEKYSKQIEIFEKNYTKKDTPTYKELTLKIEKTYKAIAECILMQRAFEKSFE